MYLREWSNSIREEGYDHDLELGSCGRPGTPQGLQRMTYIVCFDKINQSCYVCVYIYNIYIWYFLGSWGCLIDIDIIDIDIIIIIRLLVIIVWAPIDLSLSSKIIQTAHIFSTLACLLHLPSSILTWGNGGLYYR
jgi:hypothetical protein